MLSLITKLNKYKRGINKKIIAIKIIKIEMLPY